MRILFVCTGNTCRSPLAEAIARNAVAQRGLSDIQVESAGTNAWPDSPASDGSLLVGLEKGINVAEHRAQLLTSELADTADLILVMSRHHLERTNALGAGKRSYLLADFAADNADYNEIADPFGGDLDAYRATFDQLQTAINSALDRIAQYRATDTP